MIKELKPNQNSSFEHDDFQIVTTMKKVMVYKNGKLVGEAGVVRTSDFDFEVLYKLAMQKESIEVA